MASTSSIGITAWEESIARSIDAQQASITVDEFLAVLSGAEPPSAPANAATLDFLTRNGHLSEDDLAAPTRTAIDLDIAASRARATRAVEQTSMTTNEVARALGTHPPNVRRLVRDGALYSVKTAPDGHHRFPSWQIRGSRALPGLREILAALPDDYHPLEVEAFMVERSAELRGMSPADWLFEGGAISPVVALADARSWE